MIRLLKWLFPKLETTTKYKWTSTLSEPASMSDRCDRCENEAECCQNIANFQRKKKKDGRV